MGLGGQGDIWCQRCNPPQAGVKGQALALSPPPPPPTETGPIAGRGSPVLVTAAPRAMPRLQLVQGSVPVQGPEEGRGHPRVRSSSCARGRAGEAGTPFQHTPGSTEGEAGRALPAPGTAPCPRKAGKHQWHLLSQAKAEAVPIQAQG